MTGRREKYRELDALLAALCDRTAGPEDLRRIESLACDDDSVNYVLDYLQLDGLLHWEHGLGAEEAEAAEAGFGEHVLSNPALPEIGPQVPANDAPTAPRISIQTTPPAPWFSLQSPLAAGAFSYAAAVVIIAVMLLGAWAYKISYNDRLVGNDRESSPSVDSRHKTPEMVFVGRVTGMKDCRWSDPDTMTYIGSSVPLDRRYALSAGLMEITYDSGARVILEGPCTYQVESRAGGYLALGKITARVEKRSEVRGQKPIPKTQDLRPQSEIPKSPNLQISKFSVRTPTAIVTDLGTEFGVEVGKEGNTTSHVYRGSVELRVVVEGRREKGGAIQLTAGESARVEKGKGHGDARLITGDTVGTPPRFVRRIHEPPKVLDLLDIVAGGNGSGHRRERGIDPTTGMQDPSFVGNDRGGDRRYWPIAWHKLIDGVFVPDGGAGAVKLDSAGHTYALPHTEGRVYGSIWARAADVSVGDNLKNSRFWIYGIGRGGQFMPEGRGLLALCADVGITFDLEAIHQTYPEVVPSRFRAVAGLGDARPLSPTADGMADLWVFVDGRLEFHRANLRPQDGAVNVDVKLGLADRFLTLVSTDSTADKSCDWVVFGDPVLHMRPQNRKEDRASKP